MAEITTPVNVVVVDYQCDECKEGNMITDNIAMLVHPPKYQHICEKCGCKKELSERYPVTRLVKQSKES